MIFEEGYIKQYVLLRHKDPSIYNLEEFYFKVLPLKLKSDNKLYLNEQDLTEEAYLTVNFPEFLDSAENLSLIKSFHFLLDLSLNKNDELIEEGGEDDVKLFKPGSKLSNHFSIVDQEIESIPESFPFPPNLFKLYLGYRHTPLVDVRKHLKGIEALTSKRLAKMEDDCFTWIDVTNREGLKQKTSNTSVLKFKIIFDLDVLRSWINQTIPLENREAFFRNLQTEDVLLNFILHPPYMGRMSFKNSITITYPQRTTRIRTLDRISFRTNRSFVVNNKLYEILIIDKETDRRLFVFNSVTDSHLFSSIKQKIDTRKVNSYFDEEIVTFDDSVIVNFEVPYVVQTALAEHRNYKIRIVAKDLTTLDIGEK